MAETPIHERRFTDREVREILKKAVERRSSKALVKNEGLSLAELQAIGAEVGIDPDRLEDAARAVALSGEKKPNAFLGAPTVLTFERKVEGEVDPDDTPDVLALIRRTMGQQGEVDEIHGSLEWRSKGDSGERYVTLASREGTTTIQGSANLTNAALITFIPAGMVGTIASLVSLIKFVEDGSLVGLILCLTILPILYPILRTLFRKISDGEAARLDQVVNELARLPSSRED